MKKLSIGGTVVALSFFCFSVSAQEITADTNPDDQRGYSLNVIGGHVALGMATMLYDQPDVDLDNKMRFAGGFGFFYNRYFSEMVALDVGLGITGKGTRTEDGDSEAWTKLAVMEIPVGIKFNISNFMLAADIVMSIALKGKDKAELEGVSAEADWEDEVWDNHQRFNLGPRIAAGYGIPIGPVKLIPGVFWQMDLLNNAKGDAADADIKMRYMNIMFTVGGEFGF